MWTFGILLALQLSVVTWGVFRRPQPLTFAEATIPAVPPQAVPAPAPGGPDRAGQGAEAVPGTDSPPAAPGEGAASAEAPGAVSSAEAPAAAAPDLSSIVVELEEIPDLEGLAGDLEDAAEQAAPIPDTILARLVTTGEELFAAGNLQGALQALNQAEAGLPDHPRVLSGLAATYQQMGVSDRAGDYWERVLSLGEAVAGPYHVIADTALNGTSEGVALPTSSPGASAPGASAPGAVPTRIGPPTVPAGVSDAVLAIGEIRVDEQPPGETGQRISVRILVEALDGRPHAGEDLDIFVLFYDLVDGDRILESTADTSYFYPTEPYDWTVGGREEIVVQYNQPRFTPEQERELGSREYYGYAIQLYYRDQLQDTVEMPAEIARLRVEPARDQLSPGVGSGPERLGPENALFPSVPEL